MVFKTIVELQKLRDAVGFPLKITSAYRCPNHRIEKAKGRPGSHASGLAIDIACSGEKACRVLLSLDKTEFRRIGIKQHGPMNKRFIHLQICTDKGRFATPTVFSY